MAAENILVVDDDPVIGIGFRKQLGDRGYNVDCVLSGEGAVESAKRKKYDIVFIDKVMPGIDGVETCRQIKKISPGSVLVFMTGNFEKDSAMKESEFIAAGGKTYYLYKPFVEGEIREVVQKALKERGPARPAAEV